MIIYCIILFLFFFFTRNIFSLKGLIPLIFAVLVTKLTFLHFWRFIISILLVFIIWLFWPFKCPSGLSLFYGIPGSGKTTTAAFIASKFLPHKKKKRMRGKNNNDDPLQAEQGGRVYSNVPILGCLKITRDDIGKYDISNGVLIIDEAGIDFNNRFGNKNGSKYHVNEEMTEWFKLYRHYGIKTFVCFSQRVDIDLVIRGLADRVFIMQKSRIPFVVFFKGIKKVITVDVPQGSSTGQIVDAYKLSPFDLHAIFSPPYWHMFDTYDAPALPPKEFLTWGNESRY